MTPPNPNHSDDQDQNQNQIDKDEFNARLEQLIIQAQEQGIDPYGSWNTRDPYSQNTDYTVEITTVVTDRR